RIHSTGDYRNPPPPGEHQGLRRYNQQRSSPRVTIPNACRSLIGLELISFFHDEAFELRAVAVADLHAHFLVELPESLVRVKTMVGKAKEKASRAANKQIDRFRWAAGGTYKIIKDSDHLKNSIEYILTRQGPQAWTWCPQCGAPRANRSCPFDHSSTLDIDLLLD
ncbi:MAG TPA: hypothetical protein VGH65_05530, partial [Verrucomicrobiaceae bacterium]